MSYKRISVDTFNECIRQFQEISDTAGDGWILHTVEDVENGCYLTKRCYVDMNTGSKAGQGIKSDGDRNTVIGIEYNVAFHISYGVPVLCFDAWRLDGTRLSMEDYWKSNESLKDSNMFETLTQQDHPVHRKPTLMLHPCKTLEIITPLLEKSKNILISWLSVVGPYVHLILDDVYLSYC